MPIPKPMGFIGADAYKIVNERNVARGIRVLTWVGVSDESGVAEIAVEIVTTRCLIVCVHGIRRMGLNYVGLEAWPTIIYGPTLYSTSATNKVNVDLQRCITRIPLRHAPFLR
ncbi:unnamed protein product [Sphenostylis stenocarpa]|uniref:Uncharacterized protein n=1 Tax=Sphenostylis stenocarpa TaxID=92480 RepID=A0AA86S5X4_9FABA|nr:unnamed protein product [Sphenostylis stenocarpa]